ncbi:unnamed protein product [Musa banksii]
MMLIANKKMESLRNTFEVVWPLIIGTEIYERLRRRARHHHQREGRTATAEAGGGGGAGEREARRGIRGCGHMRLGPDGHPV